MPYLSSVERMAIEQGYAEGYREGVLPGIEFALSSSSSDLVASV